MAEQLWRETGSCEETRNWVSDEYGPVCDVEPVAAGALLIDAEAQERLVAFFAGYGVPAETVRLALAAAVGGDDR